MNKYFIIIILTVGAIAPTVFSQSEYLMFASYFDETKTRAFDMDTSGNLSLKEELTVGKDSLCVSTAPNGRVVIVSTSFDPEISVFFIDNNHKINNPLYLSNIDYNSYVPVAFMKLYSFAFVGFHPFCRTYDIDYRNKSIKFTDNNTDLESGVAYNIWYSEYANGLVFKKPIYDKYNKKLHGVRYLEVKNDGTFTTNSKWLEITGGYNQDFCVSPDGKWSVVIGNDDPEMSVVGINRDGSLYLVEQWDFPGCDACNPEKVRYTPDGKHLIMLNGGYHFIISFSVNQETGKLAQVDYLEGPVPVPTGMIHNFTITPDSKYLVTACLYPSGGSGEQTLDVMRLHEDGRIEWLTDKRFTINGYPSDMEFVPPWQETPFPQNGFMLYGQQEIPQQ